MSVGAMTAVFRHSAAARGAFTVMLALADWADDHGYVIYRKKSERTLAELARKSRLSVKSVIDILDTLERLGELRIDRGGAGPGDIHHYRILLPGLEEEQHLETKGEVSSPLSGADRGSREKGEVSSDKGEVSSDKGEVSSAHIRNNQSTSEHTPLPPRGAAGEPPAPPDGGRSPAGRNARGAPKARKPGSGVRDAAMGWAPPDDSPAWSVAIGSWLKTGDWPEAYGPPPDAPDCAAPAESFARAFRLFDLGFSADGDKAARDARPGAAGGGFIIKLWAMFWLRLDAGGRIDLIRKRNGLAAARGMPERATDYSSAA